MISIIRVYSLFLLLPLIFVSCEIEGPGKSVCTSDPGYVQITDASGLQRIADDLTAQYCLVNDIDLGNISFETIASGTAQFTGTLDGQGRTIQNLTIVEHSNEDKKGGLFSHIGDTGIVRNLNIDDITMTSISRDQGGLTGYNYGTIDTVGITNISIIVDDLFISNGIGSMVGVNDGIITNSSSGVGAIEYTHSFTYGMFPIGGLVGSNRNIVRNSHSTTSIERILGSPTGGLVGMNDGRAGNPIIENCYASGEVNQNGASLSTGGLVGLNMGDNSATPITYPTIRNSYASGTVKGWKEVGGLLGSNRQSAVVENSYSTGNVTGTHEGVVGGLVGENKESAVIRNSYAKGIVSGDLPIGGLVGRNSSATITDSYFDTAETELSAGIGEDDNSQSGNIGGMTASGITSGGTQPFQGAGWDFNTTWSAQDGAWPTLQ